MYQNKGIEYLRSKLQRKQARVEKRYQYYEMKASDRPASITTPPWLRGLYASCLGWCAKGVDALADRLIWRGIAEDSDALMTDAIAEAAGMDLLTDSAIRESLIGSCAFIQVAHGDDGNLPKISVLTARDATGIIDEQTGLLKEGYAVLDRDTEGHPILEAHFTSECTQYYENGRPGLREPNPSGIPLLVPVVYKPDSKRPFGHSRISRSCMYLQRYAESTLTRAEVSGEFYSFPQKYVTGLDPDADAMDTWRATVSTLLTFSKDEDGDSPTPGQFTQQSMAPYVDQLRMTASLFAGETGLTLDDLGFPQSNPSSYDAIRASHETLRLMARKAQRSYGRSFRDALWLAACVRDDTKHPRTLAYMMRTEWEPIFEPDASAIGAVGDAAVKISQAVPGTTTAQVLKDLTGIEVTEDGSGE